MFVVVHHLIVCFSLFLVHHFPYRLVCLPVSASEEGDGHGVAAAAFGAGHGLGVYRGGKLYVKRLEGVAAVVAFEFCFSSYHSVSKLAGRVSVSIMFSVQKGMTSLYGDRCDSQSRQG